MAGPGARFKKGNKFGKGKVAIPQDVREMRELTKANCDRLLNRYIYMTKQELKEQAQNPYTPAIDLFVISVIAKGIELACTNRLNFLMDRLIGKPDQTVNLNAEVKSSLHSDLMELLHNRDTKPDRRKKPKKRKLAAK